MTRISMTFAAASMTLSLAEQSPKPFEIAEESHAKVGQLPVLHMLRRGFLPAT